MKRKFFTPLGVFFVVITASVLGFGAYFAVQGNWIAAIFMFLYLLVSAFFVGWAKKYLAEKRTTSLESDDDSEEITTSELAGYIGMALLYVAAFIGTVITGDWMWAGMAVGSLLVGFWLVARELKRGGTLTLKRIFNSFF